MKMANTDKAPASGPPPRKIPGGSHNTLIDTLHRHAYEEIAKKALEELKSTEVGK